jgi:preprotein translocase subunit YajC
MNPGVFIPIAFFAAAFGIVYIIIQARNRERMAMIEKGFDANLLVTNRDPKTGKYTSLKLGIASVGIALGILVGNILVLNTNMEEPACYFSMIFLFGGLGLVTYYLIVRKKGLE